MTANSDVLHRFLAVGLALVFTPTSYGAIFRIPDPAAWSASLPTPPVVEGFNRLESTQSPVLIRGDLRFESKSGFYSLPQNALSTWIPGEAITIRLPSDVLAIGFKAYSTLDNGNFVTDQVTIRYSGGSFTESVSGPTFVGLSSAQPISWVTLESRTYYTSIDDISHSVIPEVGQMGYGVGLLLCLTSFSMKLYKRRSRE